MGTPWAVERLIFLPTPSVRRATCGRPSARCHPRWISTHALREEGDVRHRRGRRAYLRISTHALREEGDREKGSGHDHQPISTHALREEGDFSIKHPQLGQYLFLPTPSVRRATHLYPLL